MPIQFRGATYPMPGESGQPGISGRELIAIEDAFGLDALQILASIAPDAVPRPGYTKTKAVYALAWLALSRADASWTLDRMLDEVALEELDMDAEENPTNAASSEAAPAAE